jgi:3-phenylpropionate/trans-cinnamate dioxygenase ferredoxin subunit
VALVRVAALPDVPRGRTHFVCVGSKPLILANYQGEIHALSGICPHRQNPLEGAVLWDNLIDCPFHHFQFDVRTGENHFPRNVYPGDLLHLESPAADLPRAGEER